MSTDSGECGGQDAERAGADTATAAAYDDKTPRSEVPIAVKILSPSTTGEEGTQVQTLHDGDYFSTRPALAPAEQHSLSAAPQPSPSVASAPSAITSASDVTATGHLQLPDAASSLLSPQEHRPTPQSHPSSLSVESTESTTSTSTVTASSAALMYLPTPQPYPQQAFAALHSQRYPVRVHPPPVLRQRSSYPVPIHTFASALASSHQGSGARTTGNSPAVTPGTAGLYTPPNTAPPTDEYESPETPGTYASPFLHFTHRQAPKETHVADVEVDPISGRKLINHYEIIDELGRGTHGKVKLGRDLLTENTYVAIKIVERYSKRRKLGKLVSAAEDKVKKEVAILKKARHPNVVALLEVIDDPTRKKVYIVLEWVERGEIQWRAKTRKEIAMVEARRYERERLGRQDAQAVAEDEAVMLEAQRRLAREKRHQTKEHRRQVRRMLKEQSEDPESWSHELAGDELSEESEDDRLSRISTATTVDSASNRLFADSRRPSRTPSPLPPFADTVSPTAAENPVPYTSLTSEPHTMSPIAEGSAATDFSAAGLAGTMYGPYAWSSNQSSRVNSLAHSMHEEHSLPAELQALAIEILDSDLNVELEYCPMLTLQQVRVAFRDTLLGLQYLHAQGIVHRDIKPPNLLQTNEHRVKISDFGVSYLGRPMEEGQESEDLSEHDAQDFDEAKELAKTVGTPAFYAPELCTIEPGEDPPPVTKAIDVWALGITLFCMLFARTPFVDNEFVVMRQISDEDIYIPRKRLQPVNLKPASRPSSHNRAFSPQPGGKRNELEIVYEEISEELMDLLKRLLTKDPRKRILLEEVRHHPWVVADLPNKIKWLEETDPNRQLQGKKIEISNEDVKSAVVPLQFLDRVRSGIKKVSERLGLGGSKVPGRGRSGSTAGLPGSTGSASASPVVSAGSSSSTLDGDARRDARRPSHFGTDDIYAAITKSRGDAQERHGAHPLTKSVAASPDGSEHNLDYFGGPPLGLTRTMSRNRPSPPERSKTMMSTTGSIKTLKQSDIGRGRPGESPPPSPGLPGTPKALMSPGGSSLTAMLGGNGPAKRAFKSLRERSAPRGPDVRGRSMDRESVSSYDVHGEATIALSQTSAEGEVNLPQALQDIPPVGSLPSSLQASPAGSKAGSRTHSVVGSPLDNRLQPFPGLSGMLSRNSSVGSIRSISRIPEGQVAEDLKSSRQIHAPESSAEDWSRAEGERIRKLMREGQESERPTSAFDDRICPPSPDDDQMRRRKSKQVGIADHSAPSSSHETSPSGHIAQLPPAMVSSSSDFGSAVSVSVSHPSMPSVISEATSADPADMMMDQDLDVKRQDSSGETLSHELHPTLQEEDFVDEGYSPDKDQALDCDDIDEDFDDSSDSDGGLIMSRRRSKISNGNASEVLAAALGQKGRRNTGLSARSKKSSRSGSNNTMKKVRTRDSEDDRARSFDLKEED